MVCRGRLGLQRQGLQVLLLGLLPIAVVLDQREGQGQMGLGRSVVAVQGGLGRGLGLGERLAGPQPAVIAAKIIRVGQRRVRQRRRWHRPDRRLEIADGRLDLPLLPLVQHLETFLIRRVGIRVVLQWVAHRRRCDMSAARGAAPLAGLPRPKTRGISGQQRGGDGCRRGPRWKSFSRRSLARRGRQAWTAAITSFIVAGRCWGCLATIRRKRASTASGTSPRKSPSRGIDCSRWATTAFSTVSPW